MVLYKCDKCNLEFNKKYNYQIFIIFINYLIITILIKNIFKI